MEDFNLYTPTRIYFGKTALTQLDREIHRYGKRVLLIYGGGSIVKYGIYDQVMNSLGRDLSVETFKGISPNPRLSEVESGIAYLKAHPVDVLLAIGGGSVIDATKAMAVGVCHDIPLWDLVEQPKLIKKALPVIDVLTLAATGSETNPTAVLTNESLKIKKGFRAEAMFPKAAFLNPEFTYTVTPFQTASGCADIFSHLLENYLNDDYTSAVHQTMMEGLLRNVLTFAPQALLNPYDYNARANLLWTATFALNGLFSNVFTVGWSCHPLGHALGAYYDIAHGASLALVTPAWLEYIFEDKKIRRLAEYGRNVFIVKEEDDREAAIMALNKTREFFYKILKLPQSLKELGIKPNDFAQLAYTAVTSYGGVIKGWQTLTEEDALKIYEAAYENVPKYPLNS